MQLHSSHLCCMLISSCRLLVVLLCRSLRRRADAALMPFSSQLLCELCTSGIRGNEDGKEANRHERRRRRETRRGVTVGRPCAFPQEPVFDGGSSSLAAAVDLNHFLLSSSPCRIRTDGLVFASNPSMLTSSEDVSPFLRLLFCFITAPPPPLTPTWPSFPCISNPFHCGACLFGL